MILGHEGAGIVESVGEGVTKLKAGKGIFEPLNFIISSYFCKEIIFPISYTPFLHEQVIT